jgi:hypothetical protein
MDPEYQYHKPENRRVAMWICIALTVVTLLTIGLGFYLKNPYLVILGIFPAAIYEAIRTEGYYTKAGSIFIMVLVLLEIVAIRGWIHFDLSTFFGREEMYFSGFILPLGNIIFIFPAVTAIISVVLFIRTYGIYTKWLSILLLLSSIMLIYLLNSQTLLELIKSQSYYF